MNRFSKTASVVASLVLLALSASYYFGAGRLTAEGNVVGYVNSDAILEQYGPAKEVNTQLGQLREDSEKELEKKVRDKFGPGDVSTLPRESQLEIQKMVEQAESIFNEKSESLREEKWVPIVNSVNEAIEKVATEEKIQVVLEDETVIFGGVDLTDKVIEKLNENEK